MHQLSYSLLVRTKQVVKFGPCSISSRFISTGPPSRQACGQGSECEQGTSELLRVTGSAWAAETHVRSSEQASIPMAVQHGCENHFVHPAGVPWSWEHGELFSFSCLSMIAVAQLWISSGKGRTAVVLWFLRFSCCLSPLPAWGRLLRGER